jgi:hypothetical protein
MTTGKARYQITERRDGNVTSPTDPLAQAFKRHSGVFDLRDTGHTDEVFVTTTNLRELRNLQARKNTHHVLG